MSSGWIQRKFLALFEDPNSRADIARIGGTLLASTVVGPLGAESIGEAINLMVRQVARPSPDGAPVACIIPSLDSELSAGYIVYSLTPERRADGVWTTEAAHPAPAPHWFHDRYLATLYAQHLLGAQLSHRPTA